MLPHGKHEEWTPPEFMPYSPSQVRELNGDADKIASEEAKRLHKELSEEQERRCISVESCCACAVRRLVRGERNSLTSYDVAGSIDEVKGFPFAVALGHQ